MRKREKERKRERERKEREKERERERGREEGRKRGRDGRVCFFHFLQSWRTMEINLIKFDKIDLINLS